MIKVNAFLFFLGKQFDSLIKVYKIYLVIIFEIFKYQQQHYKLQIIQSLNLIIWIMKVISIVYQSIPKLNFYSSFLYGALLGSTTSFAISLTFINVSAMAIACIHLDDLTLCLLDVESPHFLRIVARAPHFGRENKSAAFIYNDNTTHSYYHKY